MIMPKFLERRSDVNHKMIRQLTLFKSLEYNRNQIEPRSSLFRRHPKMQMSGEISNAESDRDSKKKLFELDSNASISSSSENDQLRLIWLKSTCKVSHGIKKMERLKQGFQQSEEPPVDHTAAAVLEIANCQRQKSMMVTPMSFVSKRPSNHYVPHPKDLALKKLETDIQCRTPLQDTSMNIIKKNSNGIVSSSGGNNRSMRAKNSSRAQLGSMVRQSALRKKRRNDIKKLYKSTAEQKEEEEDSKLVRDLMFLKKIAEQRRGRKITENCIEGSEPKDDTTIDMVTQKQFDATTDNGGQFINQSIAPQSEASKEDLYTTPNLESNKNAKIKMRKPSEVYEPNLLSNQRSSLSKNQSMIIQHTGQKMKERSLEFEENQQFNDFDLMLEESKSQKSPKPFGCSENQILDIIS